MSDSADQSESPENELMGISTLDPEECIALLESTPIGRIAFILEGHLSVLPVNYAWVDDSIVFRTITGEKLSAARAFTDVAFEVDEWDVRSKTGWSVLVRGVAEPVNEWAEVEELEQTGLTPWAREEWRRLWVRIVPSQITGRRIP